MFERTILSRREGTVRLTAAIGRLIFFHVPENEIEKRKE